jgi:hypothetical protein
MQFVATIGTLFAVQFGDRIAALENSEGLYQLYNHPHWIKFMELVCVARTTNGISRLREWACSHPQLLPLLHRFDQCTRKYGLTIDPFLFVPPSRLMYKKNCEKQLRLHQKQAAEHQRQALRYQEILQRLKVPSSFAHKHSPDKAATSTRSDGSPEKLLRRYVRGFVVSRRQRHSHSGVGPSNTVHSQCTPAKPTVLTAAASHHTYQPFRPKQVEATVSSGHGPVY